MFNLIYLGETTFFLTTNVLTISRGWGGGDLKRGALKRVRCLSLPSLFISPLSILGNKCFITVVSNCCHVIHGISHREDFVNKCISKASLFVCHGIWFGVFQDHYQTSGTYWKVFRSSYNRLLADTLWVHPSISPPWGGVGNSEEWTRLLPHPLRRDRTKTDPFLTLPFP